jgi:hypothetical protein
MNRSVRLMICVVALSCASVLDAQMPAAPKTVAVLVVMTAKPGVERPRVSGVVSDEVRATVRLYLDGKIREWFARSDGNGVIFIMDAKNVAEAQALVEALPLPRAHLVDLQYTELSPLTPLARLLEPTTAK